MFLSPWSQHMQIFSTENLNDLLIVFKLCITSFRILKDKKQKTNLRAMCHNFSENTEVTHGMSPIMALMWKDLSGDPPTFNVRTSHKVQRVQNRQKMFWCLQILFRVQNHTESLQVHICLESLSHSYWQNLGCEEKLSRFPLNIYDQL